MRSQAELLAIYDMHRADLIRFSLSITRDPSTVEDVLQEAWMKFVRAAKKQQLDEPVAYLRTIVRTLSLDARRRMRRDTERNATDFDETMEFVDGGAPSPEQTAIARSELMQLQQIMRELPKQTQRALILYWQEEKSLREIAAILNVSVGKAHTLVRDGVEHCKTRLFRSDNLH